MKKTIPIVKFQRRINGKTNYKKRLTLLEGGKIRLVVRKSLKNVVVQFVDYDAVGDRVLITVNSKDLKSLGWFSRGNIPTAYLTGLSAGKKALAAGITDAVLDTGLHTSVKGSRIYAALKGAVDSGVSIPHSDDILPTNEDVSGARISAYAKKIEGDSVRFKKQFGYYVANNKDPKKISEDFANVKKKILGK